MFYLILAIDPHIHVLWIPLVIIASVFAGMLVRHLQLKKARKQILDLENEMMTNHAEILRLQRELSTEKPSLPNTPPPIPRKERPTGEKSLEQG